MDEGNHFKIPQTGTVLIGNDVEIGANSVVDRATIGKTIIGDMSKLDNLVHIGHNVHIGSGCLITAQVGIAGSAKIGDNCQMGGQSGVVPHVDIGSDSIIAAKANARINGVSLELNQGSIDVLKIKDDEESRQAEGQYSVVLANILKVVLEPMLPDLSQLIAGSGSLVLSGILEEEADHLISQAEDLGLVLLSRENLNDWASLHFVKSLSLKSL